MVVVVIRGGGVSVEMVVVALSGVQLWFFGLEFGIITVCGRERHKGVVGVAV